MDDIAAPADLLTWFNRPQHCNGSFRQWTTKDLADIPTSTLFPTELEDGISFSIGPLQKRCFIETTELYGILRRQEQAIEMQNAEIEQLRFELRENITRTTEMTELQQNESNKLHQVTEETTRLGRVQEGFGAELKTLLEQLNRLPRSLRRISPLGSHRFKRHSPIKDTPMSGC